MRKLTLIAVFILVNTLLFSQNDLIVIDKYHKRDTIKCKILVNSKDTVTFLSNDSIFKLICDNSTVFTALQTPGRTLLYGIRLKLIRFYQNPESQTSLADLFLKRSYSSNSPRIKLYWFGLDFSKVSIKLGTAPRIQYSNTFFLDCNDFILSEKGLSSFKKSFNLIMDTGIVTQRNAGFDPSLTFNNTKRKFTIDSVRTSLKQIKSVNEGVGVIIFITNINKISETEAFHVVFFDIKSKSLLLCLDATGPVIGIGMAHHWTNFISTYLDYFATKKPWKRRYFNNE